MLDYRWTDEFLIK